MDLGQGLNPLFGGSAFRTRRIIRERAAEGLNPLFGGSAFRTQGGTPTYFGGGLNPLFGGSAFRTGGDWVPAIGLEVLIPFLAGLLFGRRRVGP